MKPQFNNQLLGSFALWMDNTITTEGEGFINRALSFSKESVSPKQGLNSWVSVGKQMVYDSCAVGATIPSGIYNSSGQFLDRQSGIMIDWNEGRIYSPQDWGQTLTGSFAKKDFNIYISTAEQTNMFLDRLEEKYNIASGTPFGAFAAPCVFLTNAFNENEPFAFGGQDNSIRTIRAFVIANNSFNQEALLSLFVDKAKVMLPLINYPDFPINEYGDLKSGYYSYCELKNRYGCGDIYVDAVYSFKMGQNSNKNLDFFIAGLEFDLNIVRYPRQ